MPFTCPKCQTEFFDRLKYCPECGFDFTAALKRCPKCRSHVPVDSATCPECGLDFEAWAFMVPRVVVFGGLALIIVIVLISPWVWKVSPRLHDKGAIVVGQLMSEVGGQRMVPLFIHWRTGERYIVKSAEEGGIAYGSTDYMNSLIPLPPEVVFHYDMPLGEKVWIIRRRTSGTTQEWVQVGRWRNRADKYGWVHASNIRVLE